MNDLEMRGAVRVERVGGSYDVSATGVAAVAAAPGAVDEIARRVAAERGEATATPTRTSVRHAQRRAYNALSDGDPVAAWRELSEVDREDLFRDMIDSVPSGSSCSIDARIVTDIAVAVLRKVAQP